MPQLFISLKRSSITVVVNLEVKLFFNSLKRHRQLIQALVLTDLFGSSDLCTCIYIQLVNLYVQNILLVHFETCTFEKTVFVNLGF